jgi:muconolactone delta-isomerase
MFVNSPSQEYSEVVDSVSKIESELGHHNNDYLFLRSIWKSHSHHYTHAVVDLDDKLDRLNKIVAMMKKHINYSATR